MLVVQNYQFPAAIRNSIIDSLSRDITELRICSAYVTLEGSKIFHDCCKRCFDKNRFADLPKKIVTSFDYGLTEPKAIDFWKSFPTTEVRISGAEMLKSGNFVPISAFHPKMYVFCFPKGTGTVITGSANLTSRGLTINTEAVWIQKHVSQDEIEKAWAATVIGTELADDPLLQRYEALRVKRPRFPIDPDVEPVPSPTLRDPMAIPVFSENVANGVLRPERYSQMWVQVDQLQGGSRNQLELPRGAHRFFGYRFDSYEATKVEHIGQPKLSSCERVWEDRLLTWHGDNMMERINLPTLTQGGFDYQNSAILFRRLGNNVWELFVASWDSDIARAWVNASMASDNIYRLGQKTDRLVGFI